jgi:hypothetical protein
MYIHILDGYELSGFTDFGPKGEWEILRNKCVEGVFGEYKYR